MQDIESLLQENRELKIKIAAYEKILNQDLDAPPQFRFNNNESKIYNALLVTKFLHPHAIIDLYSIGSSSQDPMMVVRTNISTMRRKLEKYGIYIYYMKRHGYFLTEEGKILCQEQMRVAQESFQSTNSSIANLN